MKKIKCVIVGDAEVGKTSILMSYINRKFSVEYEPTAWYDFAIDVMIGGEPYTLSLFDTTGQEDYGRLRPPEYPGTDVFLVCFSVVDPKSYKNVKRKWVPEIMNYCPKTPFLLLGTQVDLREAKTSWSGQRYINSPITTELGEKLSKEIEAVKYVECSALTKVCSFDCSNYYFHYLVI